MECSNIDPWSVTCLDTHGPYSSQEYDRSQKDEKEISRGKESKLVVINQTVQDAGDVVEAEGEWADEGGVGQDKRFVQVP